jgi:hypothetical protein
MPQSEHARHANSNAQKTMQEKACNLVRDE